MNESERASNHDERSQDDALPTTLESPASAVPQPTRRTLIASIGALVGAALAKALARPAEALAVCEPVAADCSTVVFGTTQLDRGQPVGVSEPVLRVDAGDFTAVRANAAQGVGVVGVSGPISVGGPATMTLTIGTRAGGAFFSDDASGVVGVQSPADFGDGAIEDASAAPAGLTGLAPTTGVGVFGVSEVATGTLGRLSIDSGGGGIGVLGMQGAPISIIGASSTLGLRGSGIAGVSDRGTGVFGLQGVSGGIDVATATYTNAAVAGITGEGTGVFGSTATATGVGVLATNPSGGLALRVTGAAAFSTFGEGLIPRKTFEHDVQDPNVGENSHIMVMFTSPAKKLFVSWVEIVQGFGFRLHLSKKQRDPVSFTYLVLERDA